MGGKKKTKWRKLPLEEFTKDCPKLHERRRSQVNKATVKKTTEEVAVSLQEDVEDSSSNLNPEYSENQDGVWYPTHYLVYNPVEVPVYLIPSDTNCYYYPPNDVNPPQEYATVPYQEYIPPFKDTIYLLLPASALRPPQTAPLDWRTRRRRRYGGYAEYAVIPGKNNTDEKNKEKRELSFNLEKNNIQSSEIKTSAYPDLKQSSSNEIHRNSIQEPDIVKTEKTSEPKCNMGLSNDEKNDAKKSKKYIHACGVHNNYSERKDSDIHLKNQDLSKNETLFLEASDDSAINNSSLKHDDAITASEKAIENIQSCDLKENFVDSICETKNKIDTFFEQNTRNSDTMYNSLNTNKILSEDSYNLTGILSEDRFNSNTGPDCSSDFKNKSDFIPASLPDILNALTKMPHSTITTSRIESSDKTENSENYIADTFSNNASTTSQSIISRVPNTNLINRENKISSKQLKSQPAQINSSIYKLAFDESLTDQSDSESISSSPVDPESQMPSSLISHEINVYEADSGDEAGSEDLELIPHRYESESFLNKSKHVYENKLSLAVELLRTKESLPYDSQFKRVSEDNFLDSLKSEKESTEAENLGFVDDSNFLNSFEMKSKQSDSQKFDQIAITNQCQTSTSPSQNVSFEISLENSFTSSCEIADEVVTQANVQQENTDEVSDGYRGATFRHYFSPRSGLLNPWNCCIIM